MNFWILALWPVSKIRHVLHSKVVPETSCVTALKQTNPIIHHQWRIMGYRVNVAWSSSVGKHCSLESGEFQNLNAPISRKCFHSKPWQNLHCEVARDKCIIIASRTHSHDQCPKLWGIIQHISLFVLCIMDWAILELFNTSHYLFCALWIGQS